MSIPDSDKFVGWLTIIQKIEWWVVAAVFTATAIVLGLAYFEVLWFENLPHTILGIIGFVCILFFFLIVYRVVDSFIKTRRDKLRRSFNKLSDKQREFLIRIFQTENRHLNHKEENYLPRWLEE